MAYRQINVRSPFYVEKITSEPIIRLNLRIWRGGPILERPTDRYIRTRKGIYRW